MHPIGTLAVIIIGALRGLMEIIDDDLSIDLEGDEEIVEV